MGKRIAFVLVMVGLVCLLAAMMNEALAATCEGEPPLPPDGLVWPAEGELVQGWVFDCSSGRGHRGIDISAAGGSEIGASAAGVVIFAGYTPAEGGGTTISIEHPGGLRSTYLHLSQALVSAGEHVNQKQAIALSAGPYVHYGLKVTAPRELYFNPLLYLPGAASSSSIDAPPAEAVPVADPQAEPAAPGAGAAPAPAPQTEPAQPDPLGQVGAAQPTTKPAGEMAAASPELETQPEPQALAPRSAQGVAPGLPAASGRGTAEGVSLVNRAREILSVNSAGAGGDSLLGLTASSWAPPVETGLPEGGAASAELKLKTPAVANQAGERAVKTEALERAGWESQRSGPMRGLINTLGALLLLGMAVLAAKATRGRLRPAAFNIS